MSSATPSEHDLWPNYRHKYPLVRTRGTLALPDEAHESIADFDQVFLSELGFDANGWIPSGIARKWRSPAYPAERSIEAVY